MLHILLATNHQIMMKDQPLNILGVPVCVNVCIGGWGGGGGIGGWWWVGLLLEMNTSLLHIKLLYDCLVSLGGVHKSET